MGWLFVLVMGVIIGLLGKFVAPGDRDNIPLWLTVLCGIGGVLIGYYVAAAWKKYTRPDEIYICDTCMFADPRYIADYGDHR